jgi:hypothetical protein
LQKISQPDPGDIDSDEVVLIHSDRLRLIADICLFLLRTASFLNHAWVLRQTATTSRTLGRISWRCVSFQARSFLERLKSRMLQISQAFPAIFFQPCQNDLEFNSREGVSFTGAVLRVSSWGPARETPVDAGLDLYVG